MKKVLSLLVLFSLAFVAIGANVAPSATQKYMPVNVGPVVNLHTTTAASADTFDAAEVQTYGPYEICPSSGAPMYKVMMLQADAATGTTPTISVDYQLIPSLSITDTASIWTPIDTITGTATSATVDISDEAGKGIVFRLNCYDGVENQVPGKIRFFFKSDESFQIKR